MSATTKTCTSCRENLPIGSFHKSGWKGEIQRYSSKCKVCKNREERNRQNLITSDLAIIAFPGFEEYYDEKLNQGRKVASVRAGSKAPLILCCPRGHVFRIQFNRLKRSWKSAYKGCQICAKKSEDPEISDSVAGKTEMLALWDSKINLDVLPKHVYSGSSSGKCAWKCASHSNHKWYATPGDIAHSLKTGNTGCPYCAGKLPCPENWLANYPEIAKHLHPSHEANREKGKQLTPEDIVARSNKRRMWVCYNGPDHTWDAKPNDRVGDDSGCPFCSVPAKRVSVTNSLAQVKFNHVAREFHGTRNVLNDKTLKPSDVIAHSNKKFWWVCLAFDNHPDYLLAPNARLGLQLSGCPKCHPVPHSITEIRLLFELGSIFDIDPSQHQIPEWSGAENDKRKNIDVLIPEIRLVIEFDSAYYHKMGGSRKVASDMRKLNTVEEKGWKMMRVREEPLKAIGSLGIVVNQTYSPAQIKITVDKILNRITKEPSFHLREEVRTEISHYLRERGLRKREEADAYWHRMVAAGIGRKALTPK